MAARNRHLVAYDIRDARRLRRVHSVAKEYGYALQYSVFVCDLTGVELVALKRALADEINLTVDSVAVMDLGPPDGRGTTCVEYLGRRPEIPDGGPPVW